MLHLGGSLVALVLTVLVAIWVYNDAEKRGAGNSILWAIGTFFLLPDRPDHLPDRSEITALSYAFQHAKKSGHP